MNPHHAHQEFYGHLKMHPNAHKSACAFLDKLESGDLRARQALKKLARTASHDPRAANALRILAVTAKNERPTMIMGGMPALVQSTGRVLKLALSPAAWALSQGGTAFHWAGRTLQHIAQAI